MAGRIAVLRSSAAAAAEEIQATAVRARHRWAAVDTAFAVHERDRRAAGSLLAGAVAFRLFIYLLPLYLAAVAVLGLLTSLGADVPRDLGNHLGMSSYLVDSIQSAAGESRRSWWVLAPLALWAVYWAGIGAVRVLNATHALAWGLPIRRLRRGWLAAVGASGFALLVVGSVTATQVARQHSERVGLGVALLQAVVLIGSWWLVSRAMPHAAPAGWSGLLPGAVLFGLGAWLLHVLSAYLLARRVASASALYGSLGVAAAILAWLYLLGRLVVASAILNATLWERRTSERG